MTDCRTAWPIGVFILIELAALLPFAMIRRIQKLSGTALIADVFILLGIIYIFGNEISVISARGIADVKLFNPESYSLLIGTAVFSFEGIGLGACAESRHLESFGERCRCRSS